MGKEIKEADYYNRQGNWNYSDARMGHGYGSMAQKMGPRPSSAGFPYDLYDLEDECEDCYDEFDDPIDQKKFASKMDYVVASDPNQKRDPFHYFDHNTVGLAEEKLIRDYIRESMRSAGASAPFRLKPRSSEPDGAVTQWGTRIPGGTQFGWSSAYQFPQKKEPYEPVFSLKDLMTKHEDQWDRTRGELEKDGSDIEEDWKEEWGEEEWSKDYPLFW